MEEQMAQIRKERRARFDEQRASDEGRARPSDPEPAPTAPAPPERAPPAPPATKPVQPAHFPSTSSDNNNPPRDSRGAPGTMISGSIVDAVKRCGQKGVPEPNGANAKILMNRYGADASIGDMCSDAPPRPKPVPPPKTPMQPTTSPEEENAAITIEVNQAPFQVLRVLSWNIDGLDTEHGDLVQRTIQAVSDIVDAAPTVVFLQELIMPTLNLIRRLLHPLYHILSNRNPPGEYFTAILLLKKRVKLTKDVKIVPFPNSKMARELLNVECEVDDFPVYLSTSHLESLKDCSDERKEQLKIALERLASASTNKIGLFGGDCNLRDAEVNPVTKGLTAAGLGKFPDAWESAGKPDDAKFTWDLRRNNNAQMPGASFVPRCRFDRMYFRGTTNPCKNFKLVGTKKVEGVGRFPSDHFGIMMEWDLVQNAPAQAEASPMKVGRAIMKRPPVRPAAKSKAQEQAAPSNQNKKRGRGEEPPQAEKKKKSTDKKTSKDEKECAEKEGVIEIDSD